MNVLLKRTGPVTVISQVGEYKRLVRYVARAWFDIQALHQTWKFLRLAASWVSVAGQAGYTPLQCNITSGTFGLWHHGDYNFRGYLTASGTPGEFVIPRISWNAFHAHWEYNTARDLQSQPNQCAIKDDDSIYFGPKPNAGYTFLADYYRNPILMSVDADVPALPAKHSTDIIVFKAMINWGVHKRDPGLITLGEREYRSRLNSLELDQLERPVLAGALC